MALEQGDGTALMREWAQQNVGGDNLSKVLAASVPADAATLASLPPVLSREYEFPFLEGRAFVDALRSTGGWTAVDAALADALPQSTEK